MIVLSLTFNAQTARAAETDETGQAEEIDTLIESVMGKSVKDRMSAMDKLVKIGKPAIEPLAEAADSDEANALLCFDVLGRMLGSEEKDVSEAAEEALKELTESDTRPVSIRAKTTLRLKKVLQQREAMLKAGPGAAPAVPGVGNVQIVVGGLAMRRSTKIDAKGRRTIEATEGEEKIEISDTNGKDIELKHTRLVDGKSKTDEFKATDLDDLKKKNPDAAKLYEKHTAGNNVVIGGAGGGALQIQIGGVARPIAPPGFQVEPAPSGPGPRTIRAEQDGRRVEISDGDGSRIRVKVTTTVDGKEMTQEYAAEDLAALKSENPDIARLYEKFTGRKAE